ncbi:TetR family transcriptional regulator [Nocardioides rubriscoriae]|uniref:TetR family transcriptional regulator n=1 Tax=Nocardioides rubriscoriae TaxID=642762 RepID=UPI001478D158|nr:TetR family transcriptional regulator [Nocardioides rubriscoriae]
MAGLRERQKVSTRRSLEDAALRLFAERGYDATTIEAIAEQAEVSPRTFFRYFAAKDEVLDMGWDRRQAELVSRLSALPRDLDDAAAAAWVLRTMAEDFLAERERVELRAAALASSPTLRGRAADSLLAWQATLAAVLAERAGLDHPTFAHRVTAAAAVATWVAAFGEWISDPGSDLVALLDAGYEHLHGTPLVEPGRSGSR